MFELHVLAAAAGDCLLLSWGDPETPHHLLIDAGLDWNHAFDGQAVAVPDHADTPLPTVHLPGDLRLTAQDVAP